MDKNKYQNFVLWKAQNPDTRKPQTISEYLQDNKLTIEEVESYMNHENYSKDLMRAVRFFMVNELPDLLWSLNKKAKTRLQGKDLESLTKLVLDPKTTKDAEDDANIFTDFTESIDPKQAKQIAKRMLKKQED